MNEHTTGIINLYKPSGLTCAEFMNSIVKKKFNFKKIGYSGTLDKFAEGILPVLINKATKIAKFLEAEDKEYIAQIKFGIQTDTLDITGKIIKEYTDYVLDFPNVLLTLQKFIGEIYQTPPKYSGIKIHGKRASDLVRAGKNVQLKPRKIKIYNIELLSYDIEKNQIEIKVSCSKGTYIRALARDIGKNLNTGAIVTKLVRSKSGLFDIKDAIKKEELEKIQDITQIKIFTINEVLSRYPSLTVKSQYKHFILNGKKLNRFMFVDYGEPIIDGIYRVVDLQNNLIAMVEYKKEKFCYLRVFK